MSTKSAAAQGASRPAAVTCHRDLGFFSAEASAVTPTSLARGSGARAPPTLGNSARVSPFDIAAAAVTSREVEDQGRDSRAGRCGGHERARSGRVLRSMEKGFLTICPYKRKKDGANVGASRKRAPKQATARKGSSESFCCHGNDVITIPPRACPRPPWRPRALASLAPAPRARALTSARGRAARASRRPPRDPACLRGRRSRSPSRREPPRRLPRRPSPWWCSARTARRAGDASRGPRRRARGSSRAREPATSTRPGWKTRASSRRARVTSPRRPRRCVRSSAAATPPSSRRRLRRAEARLRRWTRPGS